MRILFACEFFWPSRGGVQETIRQVGEHLVKRGHTVTVATSYLPDRTRYELNGVRIVDFKAGGSLVRGMAGDVEGYRRFVLENDYDVFMVMHPQQWQFDALWPILDRLRHPIVFHMVGLSALHDAAYRRYYEAMPGILAKFDDLVYSGSTYRDITWAKAHGLPAETVIPNGASDDLSVARDPGFRARHGIPSDAFVVLTVGSFNGEKGHREVAEAFELAAFGGRRAVLILSGSLIPRPMVGPVRRVARLVRRWARSALRGRPFELAAYDPRAPIDAIVGRINRGDSGKRAIIAELDRPELVQAYLNSDLFAFASNVECSPVVLFEAAAAGLPFVSVPVGNVPEIVEWLGSGEVCPAPTDERGYSRVDPAVLADHISRLAADPVRLAELGAAGRRNWADKFTWPIVAGMFEALFQRLIEKTTNRRGGGHNTSAAALAERFARGDRLDVAAEEGFVPGGRHQEVELPSGRRRDVPTVTVVIPCFNQAEFLAEAVDSVVAQSFDDWEVIIVDDGSPDDTAAVAGELIQRHSTRRIRLLRQANGGPSTARNTGIAAARGRYILPLDSDDVLAPEMLARTVALLESEPSVAIAYTDSEDFGATTRRVEAGQWSTEKLCRRNPLAYCALYRREVWEAVGGYDPKMVHGYEDWDFWIGAARRGYQGRRIAEPLLRYRVRPGTRSAGAATEDRRLRAQIRRNHPEQFTIPRRAVRWLAMKAGYRLWLLRRRASAVLR